jgi:TolA-binding protein
MIPRGMKRIVLGGAAAWAALAWIAAPARAVSADSLRQEVSRLASQGRLDEALDQVERNASSLPGAWNAMFRGKLELDGDKAARGYKAASADSAPPQMRGEALFRQGQYQYAAGRYHLAIPHFREYLSRYPTGVWSEPSAYWMAYACIQLVRQRPGREAYLDSAQAYLRKLEFRGRSGY